MSISGDGFVTLADGSRRWGRFGAAGILARHVGADGHWYFVALRSGWTHQGGTWAMPGGALNQGESPLDGALREFEEEVGALPPGWTVAHVHEDDHGGWSYWTHVLDVPDRFEPPPITSWETADVQWVHEDDLPKLPLFAAFRATLAQLGLLQLSP